MKARAVIGANFGDEGKGLVTDYLCATQGAGMVVRFNGGSQAGHTVVTPDGLRHVFSHFGAGTLAGVPTFLSQFFVCNPIMFFRELDKLAKILPDKPVVYAHPDCLVSTFADMMINQIIENKRGADRHGSCGLGINETIMRSDIPGLKITMSDLWNESRAMESKLREICTKYAEFRTGKALIIAGAGIDLAISSFLNGCRKFAEYVNPLGIAQCKDPVFEGSQGLLLDQNNKEYFPHLTRSNTGMQNVRILCEQAGIKDIEAYYVSRTYLTRHGAGPLPGENAKLRYEDDTNVDHPYQGGLRFAPLDHDALMARCQKDFGGSNVKLVLTHADQCDTYAHIGDLTSFGPARQDMVPVSKKDGFGIVLKKLA
jgi:adenylosuccinate synthase